MCVADGSGSSSLTVSLVFTVSHWAACFESFTGPSAEIVHSMPRGLLSSPSSTSALNSSATSLSHLHV